MTLNSEYPLLRVAVSTMNVCKRAGLRMDYFGRAVYELSIHIKYLSIFKQKRTNKHLALFVFPSFFILSSGTE